MSLKLHITPEMIEGAYELLRSTPPFKRWGMPHPDRIEFRVVADRGLYGYAETDKVLAISCRNVGQLKTLLEKVAHEMVHMRLYRIGRGRLEHGPVFQRLADQVCRQHGFDRGAF